MSASSGVKGSVDTGHDLDELLDARALRDGVGQGTGAERLRRLTLTGQPAGLNRLSLAARRGGQRDRGIAEDGGVPALGLLDLPPPPVAPGLFVDNPRPKSAPFVPFLLGQVVKDRHEGRSRARWTSAKTRVSPGAGLTILGQTLRGTYQVNGGDELLWTFNGTTAKLRMKVIATELEVSGDGKTITYKRV